MQLAAIAFFVLLLAALIGLAVFALRKSDMNPLQCLLWGVAYLLCKFLWRTRWLNRPQLPRGRGAIIVCNHRSSVDPFFVQASTGRKIHWMVAREYCQHSAFGGFLRTCEVIPVGRGGIDTAATKAAIRLAESGDVVGMLPEGQINMSEEFMLPVRPGAALVAIKAGVPVIPCYIRGAPYRRTVASPFFMPARVEIRFGQPLHPDAFRDDSQQNPSVSEPGHAESQPSHAERFMLAIVRALADLAGQPNFQPRLAGRSWKRTATELEAAIAAKDAREGLT